MGVVSSKSPLERRNTVLRRSQRKSMHGIKSKTGSIMKDIKKFKGTSEEDAYYMTIKSKIDNLQRELELKNKNLQPELRNLHKDTTKQIEMCFDLLQAKLEENRGKAKSETQETVIEADDNNKVNEVDEAKMLEGSNDKRRTVELKLVQIHSTASTPESKRLSIMKMGGVPVMPGSIMDSLQRKSVNFDTLHRKLENRVSQIKKDIEATEYEISEFVGKKYGKHYNNIKERLFDYLDVLKGIETADDAIIDQINLCKNYVSSCLTFLDEKAVDVEEAQLDGDDDVFKANTPVIVKTNSSHDKENNLSPRTIRTTYI